MPTCSFTDEIIIEDEESINKLADILEQSSQDDNKLDPT